jgi:PAS domain S-box-containing protein
VGGENAVLNAINAGLIIIGPDGLIVQWNAWVAHATGKSSADARGKTLQDVFPPEAMAFLQNAYASAIASGTSTLLTHALHPGLLRLKTRAAQPLLHDVSVSAVGHAPNRSCLIQITDVTLAARRERFLRDRQNARYDALVASASDVIMTLDSDGIIRLINAAAKRQFGYSVEDLVGRDATVLFETRGVWKKAWAEVSDGKVFAHPVELIVRRKDGSLRYFEASASRWLDGSRVFITAIFRDINERREADAALRASEAMSRSRALALASLNKTLQDNSEALNAVDRRKDEFLATLAHELRNPLAPLRNALQLLKLAKGDPKIVEESRNMMERQVVQMVRLIDDLLDISRISEDKIELSKERASLDRIIFQAAEISRPLLDAQRHRLTINIPDEQIMLNADVVRLTQVVANLLNNAAKYTKEGGEITVDVRREADVAVIRVIDNGVGIPNEMLSKIFELFMQVDNSLERTRGGLGIGLSLVKRLTEMHGG